MSFKGKLPGEKKAVKASIFVAVLLAFPAAGARAMHIMEGFLPPAWCVAWGALCIPFLVKGFFSIKKKLAGNSRMLLLLAMCGAFAFVLRRLAPWLREAVPTLRA